MNDLIDNIWQYSHYYGDMLSTVLRLHDKEEDYAAIFLLFNALELICKSVRENFKQNFIEDINDLRDRNILSEKDYEFLLNKEFGVRVLRNIMTHRNAYQYCLEDVEGYALPFSEVGTWTIVFEKYAHVVIKIIYELINKSQYKK